MKLTVATLAQHVSVRSAVMEITHGGISQITPSVFPFPVPLHLALSFLTEPEQDGAETDVGIEVSLGGEEPIGRLDLHSTVETPADLGAPPSYLNLAIPLSPFVLSEPGGYLISILVDDAIVQELPLAALPAPSVDTG